MKTKNILLLSSLLLALRFAPGIAAQDAASPTPSATPAVCQSPAPNSDHHGILTPEEWQKLKAAREKAMLDPNVKDAQENKKAADEAFRAARKQALLAQDPSLGPILDKLEAALKANPPEHQGKGGQFGPPERDGRRMKEALATLTPEERGKLKTAQKNIKNNPDFVSAKDKKQQADQQFASVLHAAMIAADPTVEPLLKKVEEARPHGNWRNEGGQPPAKE